MGKECLDTMHTNLKNDIETDKLDGSFSGNPTYKADGLMVWNKDTSFLEDAHFMDAYKLGMDSGHKIGRSAGTSDDIHIEWRILVCCWAGWHAKQLPGHFVECGTNTGIMSLAICKYINFNALNKNFYLFDTFKGMPEHQITPEEQKLGRLEENKMYEDCYELTKRNFSIFPRAKLIRGEVPDTLKSIEIDKILLFNAGYEYGHTRGGSFRFLLG